MMANERIVVDTSVIVDGRISEHFMGKGTEILVPRVVVQELEHQANIGKSVGNEGLDELNRLQEANKSKKVILSFVGDMADEKDIKYAYAGKIDSIIRELAKENKATLVTSDKTQANVAKVYDIPCIYFEPRVEERKAALSFEGYFDEHTMSIHLKEGVEPHAKKGKPGDWKLVKIGEEKLSKEILLGMIDEIIECAHREEGMVEIDRKGCTIVQLGPYRIVITKFPFSEAVELTIVKPIVSLTLEEYHLPEKLKKRLAGKAEGVLVVGAPGAGKSTFAQALANFYADSGKVVKTMEQPRDLQLGPHITQYSALDGSMKNTGDILLLVRPDYTIYDEIRKGPDFLIFEDLRLAGVGMVGVTHAAAPIDAIQRFVGRVELGVIPQVVDTILYIEGGNIKDVYTLNINVKVPTGMTEQDLARPVVEVKDFDTGDLEYEIYTYGEEVVVIPVKQLEEKNRREFAMISQGLSEKIRSIAPDAAIENEGKSVTVRVPERQVARIVGRGGKVVDSLEREFGVSINVVPSSEGGSSVRTMGKGKNLTIDVGRHNAGQYVKLFAGDEYILTAIVNNRGEVALKRKSKNGRKVSHAMDSGKQLRCEVAT
jgi:ATPase